MSPTVEQVQGILEGVLVLSSLGRVAVEVRVPHRGAIAAALPALEVRPASPVRYVVVGQVRHRPPLTTARNLRLGLLSRDVPLANARRIHCFESRGFCAETPDDALDAVLVHASMSSIKQAHGGLAMRLGRRDTTPFPIIEARHWQYLHGHRAGVIGRGPSHRCRVAVGRHLHPDSTW